MNTNILQVQIQVNQTKNWKKLEIKKRQNNDKTTIIIE